MKIKEILLKDWFRISWGYFGAFLGIYVFLYKGWHI